MGKIAFVFPGQGSQRVGMAREFYQEFEVAKETFLLANEVLGFDITSICFNGPQELLSQTQYTQVAVLTTSIACLGVVKEEIRDLKPSCVAGHSLGEYSALVAADVVGFPLALKIVKKRALFMEEEAKEHPGGMLAVLGAQLKEIEIICQRLNKEGVLQIANLNCPGQIILSGEERLLREAEILARPISKKILRLSVSGPFHSILMEKAGKRLKGVLEGVKLEPPNLPIVANFSGDYILSVEEIKEALSCQIYHPVLWEQSIHRMIEDGVSTFIEIGPGRVLSGLIKRIDSKVLVLGIEDKESLKEAKRRLQDGVGR